MIRKLFPFLLVILLTSAYSQDASVISENANLRGTPSTKGKVVDVLAAGSNLEVIKQKGVWFLVQAEDFVGWIHGDTIRLEESRIAAPERKVFDLPPVPSQPRVTQSSDYIRGPRGGCYYINRNGNKTYVDRSMCD